MFDVAKAVKMGIISLLAAIIFLGSWFVVPPGFVGVTFSRVSGQTESHSQGTHLKLPLLTGVEKFDVRSLRWDITAESASKDLQKVNVHVALNTHLEYDKVNELYVKVGSDYGTKIIEPAVNEAVKAAAAQLPVESIIVKREELKNQIEITLKKHLAGYNIFLENVNLVNIGFDDQFNQVVEEKQIEEQKIKTAQYVRMQAEEQKKTAILQAEAESEKQRLMRQTVTKDIIALKWIEKWDGNLPEIMAGDKGAMLMITPKSSGEQQ